MTTAGWIIMIVSVGGVTAFFAITLYLVLSKHGTEGQVHSTMEETPDKEDD